MNYPLTIPWHFEPVFQTKREATDLAKEYNGKVTKLYKNAYKVIYNSTISNIQTTGRRFYVIDNEGELHFKVITLIKSYPFEGSYKIEGFEGIFICNSNWYCDIYVNTIFDNHPAVKETIKELSIKGKKEQIEHEFNCRASRQFIDALTKTEWQKAKEGNYI